nr:hypothetical protein [Psychrobacter sp. PraFG1]UTT87776.1 hypothetical protein MN210_17310 [Psychrobacter sp. PraFG1]UTT87798.1 hypothetical protein MN210_17260 [Psychrobacter sp. PraFG1]
MSKADDHPAEQEHDQVEQPDDTDYTDNDIRELFSDPQVDAFPPMMTVIVDNVFLVRHNVRKF